MLTDPLEDHLEACQGEIGRILKLSKFHSTLATYTARILISSLVC